MPAVVCRCGKSQGILEFKLLKLRVLHAQKPGRNTAVSPLRTLKSGKMVASCCSEPLCDMLGNPILSSNVSTIQFANVIDEETLPS